MYVGAFAILNVSYTIKTEYNNYILYSVIETSILESINFIYILFDNQNYKSKFALKAIIY